MSGTTSVIEQDWRGGSPWVPEHPEHDVVSLRRIIGVWPIDAAVRVAVGGEARFVVRYDVEVTRFVFAHGTP